MHACFPFPNAMARVFNSLPATTPSINLTIAAHSTSRSSIPCHIQFSSRNQLALTFQAHRSPLQLGLRLRTQSSRRRRQLSVSVGVGGASVERRLTGGVVAMAASPGEAVLYFMEFFIAGFAPAQAFREINGDNTRYSKFATSEGKEEAAAMIASKKGMFLIYFPAALLASVFLACRLGIVPVAAFLESAFGAASGAATFWEKALVADAGDQRLVLVAAALFVHFSKRVLEVLFVHKYSGTICVADSTQISISYTSQVCLLLYSQLLSATGSEATFPFLNLLKWLGVALFLIGVTGNAYHHWLLSHLRKDHGKKQKYVVPQGGLFSLLVCPHYVFEMVDMMGIALISQTLFSVCMVWFVLWYLTGRSIASKKWYMKKVEGFPEDRKVLIPGIF